MAKQFPNKIQESTVQAAGHAKREQLKRRSDQLAEQGEQLAADMKMDGFSEAALTPDDEIQAMLWRDGSEVTNAQPGYCYMWVCVEFPSTSRGMAVLGMQSQGWVVVGGNDPESPEYRTVDGTRKYGDAILMRITEQQKRANDYRVDLINAKRSGKEDEATQELAERYGIRVVSLDNLSPEHRRIVERRAAAQNAKHFAKNAAMQKLDEDIRTGSVPGMSIGT